MSIISRTCTHAAKEKRARATTKKKVKASDDVRDGRVLNVLLFFIRGNTKKISDTTFIFYFFPFFLGRPQGADPSQGKKGSLDGAQYYSGYCFNAYLLLALMCTFHREKKRTIDETTFVNRDNGFFHIFKTFPV